MKYYKIFNEKELHNGLQYKDGINEDILPFNSDHSERCVSGGLYFSDKESILDFLSYGVYIREVEPIGEIIPIKGSGTISKYRAPSLKLHKRRDLRERSTWEWLKSEGIEINHFKSNIFIWACRKGGMEVFNHYDTLVSDVFRLDQLKYENLFQNIDTRIILDGLQAAVGRNDMDIAKYLMESDVIYNYTASDIHNAMWVMHRGYDSAEVVKYIKQKAKELNDKGLLLSHLDKLKQNRKNELAILKLQLGEE